MRIATGSTASAFPPPPGDRKRQTETGLQYFLLAYVAGIIFAPFLEFTPLLKILPLSVGFLWLICHRRRGEILLLFLFFWALGIINFHLAVAPPREPGHISAFVGDQPINVEGLVLTVSDRTLGGGQIDIEASRVGLNGILAPVRGKIRLFLDGPATGIRPGATIRFRSRLRAPRTFGTPGEFEYPRHLARQGIFVVAYLENARGLATMGSAPDRGLSSFIESWRRRLAQTIDERLPPASAPLVKALIIGDKGNVTPQQRDLLARGGVSHLFAISGLHLGTIGFFLFSAALIFYRRCEPLLLIAPPQRLLPLALLPVLLLYLLLSGNALPTRRAFLMAIAGSVLVIRGRRTLPSGLLASIALLVLLFEPLALFEPSFQLSFAGVLGILLFLPRCRQKLAPVPRLLRWAGLMFMTTLAATLATTPFVLMHFHLLAPAGLLTNLFAVPAIGFLAVPTGLSGALLVPFFPDAGILLLGACGTIIDVVLLGVDALARPPLLGGWKIFLSPLQTSGAAFLCASPFLTGGRIGCRLGRCALLAAGTVLVLWSPATPAALTVTVFSVGQGDAILLSRVGGRNYLVDGGGLHSPTFDVGERLLAPALGYLGIRNLDTVFLTHDQSDHRQGLLHVLEQFPVGSFQCPEEEAHLDQALVGILRRRGITTIHPAPGWTILEESGETSLALFAPNPATSNPNDRSIVLYVRQGSDGILLTGDLESAGVKALLTSPPPGPVTLMKLPHHGSRNSSPDALLDGLRPHYAFVSAGAGNSFHFPHEEVLEALEKRGIPLYRTDLSGTLRFLSDGNGWHIQQWQRGLFR